MYVNFGRLGFVARGGSLRSGVFETGFVCIGDPNSNFFAKEGFICLKS